VAENLEQDLSGITLAPYIFKAMALIGIRRKGGGNMFRHQVDTLGILIDYKIIHPVLLKAAVIHDLVEDAPDMPGASRAEIEALDRDGPQVFELLMEVTRRKLQGNWEPKSEYLLRIMHSGSQNARLLKLADRISNLIALGFVHDEAFVMRFIKETRDFVLPFAQAINPDMHREIRDLILDREERLSRAQAMATGAGSCPARNECETWRRLEQRH